MKLIMVKMTYLFRKNVEALFGSMSSKEFITRVSKYYDISYESVRKRTSKVREGALEEIAVTNLGIIYIARKGEDLRTLEEESL